MKQLLMFLLLGFGTAAFANTDEQYAPPTDTARHEATMATAKKTTAKVAKPQDTAAKPAVVKEATQKEIQQKAPAPKNCTSIDGSSRFGISAYLVEFVHTNNIKLVKLLL
jgi:uncharacterized phage protein gp47/JayE